MNSFFTLNEFKINKRMLLYSVNLLILAELRHFTSTYLLRRLTLHCRKTYGFKTNIPSVIGIQETSGYDYSRLPYSMSLALLLHTWDPRPLPAPARTLKV